MATETVASRGAARWYQRQAPRLLAGALALVALAVVAVEVVLPLSAGLPVGWGQFNKAEFHLHVGTPPFWNVTADNALDQGALINCSFAVVASPPTEAAPRTTLDSLKAPRWMRVDALGPCASAGGDPQASLWRATGKQITVAGQTEPLQIETVGAPQVSYRVSVTLRGFRYTFSLQDPSAAQAQHDMPDFLTFVRSFRYTS